MHLKTVAALSLAAALSSGTAFAADLIIPTTPQPIMESAGFDWDGFYVGARGGAQAGGDTNGLVGAFVGVNFNTGSGIVAGVEVDADYVFNDDFNAGEVLVSGRVGALVTDDVLVYAKAGVGNRETNNDGNAQGAMYAFGGGVELAVADSFTVRTEVLGQGFFGDDAPNDGGPVAAKATIGVAYHF